MADFDMKQWIAIQQAALGDVTVETEEDKNVYPDVLQFMERYQKMNNLLVKE